MALPFQLYQPYCWILLQKTHYVYNNGKIIGATCKQNLQISTEGKTSSSSEDLQWVCRKKGSFASDGRHY